jgi:methionyl-tRNA formyltransferase
VLGQGEILIGPGDTIADLHQRANGLFPQLVTEVLAKLEAGTLVEHPQDPARARYWHQRSADDGCIEWATMTARQVHDLVRGVTRPYPGAFSYADGQRVSVWRTAVPDMDLRGVPGRVCWIQKSGPYVVCADRAVLLLDYEVEGSGRLRTGTRLGGGRSARP